MRIDDLWIPSTAFCDHHGTQIREAVTSSHAQALMIMKALTEEPTRSWLFASAIGDENPYQHPPLPPADTARDSKNRRKVGPIIDYCMALIHRNEYLPLQNALWEVVTREQEFDEAQLLAFLGICSRVRHQVGAAWKTLVARTRERLTVAGLDADRELRGILA